MNKAMGVLNGVAAAGKSVANDIVGAATRPAGGAATSTPAAGAPPSPPQQQPPAAAPPPPASSATPAPAPDTASRPATGETAT
jgi:hypothetical protein